MSIESAILKLTWILFILLIAGCAEKGPDGLTICCAGDSLMRPIPRHLRKLMPVDGANVDIKDWARGGLSSQTYMSFYRKRVQRQKRYSVDFILFQLGTNDVRHLFTQKYSLTQFDANLKIIIDEFRKFPLKRDNSIKILIASIPPLYAPEYQEMNSFIQNKLNPVLKKLSETEALIFVDNWKVLKDRLHLYRPDGIHPNSQGEWVLAQNWIIAMRRAVRSSIP
ncbi:SGNH/GDSL hydrolase family protein [Acidobacteriota bacterium]